jgi:hypothetical protein
MHFLGLESKLSDQRGQLETYSDPGANHSNGGTYMMSITIKISMYYKGSMVVLQPISSKIV